MAYFTVVQKKKKFPILVVRDSRNKNPLVDFLDQFV